MKGSGGGGGGGRKFSMIPFVERNKKEKDEDLVLFRELNRREKDRFASLLQPVSDEFEPNAGNYSLYRIGSGKKGTAYESLGENNKNDYDWLKTPPATPLFPSLEMEAQGPELVVQREIPILQPLSRFAGNSATTTNKGSSERPKSPKPKPNPNPKPKIPGRSITPSHRPITKNNSSTETKNTKVTTTTLFPNYKTATTSPTTHLFQNPNKKPNTNEKQQSHDHHFDFITSNLSKTLGLITTDTKKTNPKSRGVSPSMRSTIPAQIIPGFSNEPPPPNLRTDNRPTSATRGRPVVINNSSSSSSTRPKSVTRSRKVEEQPAVKQKESSDLQNNKGRFQTQILGSRMVEKVMNARKSGAEDRETKSNNLLRGSNNNNNNNSEITAGFIARNMMPRSSLDVALLKHNNVVQQQETRRDGTTARQLGTLVHRRSSTRE